MWLKQDVKDDIQRLREKICFNYEELNLWQDVLDKIEHHLQCIERFLDKEE